MDTTSSHFEQPSSSSPSAIITNGKNLIQLKNQSLQPEVLKILIHENFYIKVAHNNSFGFSQISPNNKKYIFAIEQLDEQSDPLQQGQQYEFSGRIFPRVGEFKIVCINMPKVFAKIIVEKGNSQSADELFDEVPNISINQQDLFIKTPVKLAEVKQQQPEDENLKETKEENTQNFTLSASKSDFQQYERILTEEDDGMSDTLQNKYLKYFKQEFKLWRNFFEEQEKKQIKETLKSKHTKNLSLSEVKEIQPKNRSDYDSDHDSGSGNNSSSIGKGISIASQLYSHQQILDRNNDEDINSGKKQMKKTNSEYGFNIMRSQEKQPTLDKISVFGKEQQQINLPSSNFHHSRRSNHESSKAIKNNEKKKSRISMSRTQTNSPALREYKKDNNFLTWAVEWAKEKQYKSVLVDRKSVHHLVRQFDVYMKNKFKIGEFLYC